MIDMIEAGKKTIMAFKFQSAHVNEMCSHKKETLHLIQSNFC